MFKSVLVAGDSFAFGNELEDKDNNRYSALISSAFNAKEYNFALGGLGNELISSYLITEASHLISQDIIKPEETLVLVSWSSLHRTCFYNKINSCFLVSWGQQIKENIIERQDVIKEILNSKHKLSMENLYNFFQSHTDELYNSYNTFKHIYLTQQFLDSHKFKYVFLTSNSIIYHRIASYEYELNNLKDANYNLNNISFQKHKLNNYGYHLPDPKYFLDKINLDSFFNVYIDDYADKNKFKKGPNGHPLDDTHKAYSSLLLDHIKNKWN